MKYVRKINGMKTKRRKNAAPQRKTKQLCIRWEIWNYKAYAQNERDEKGEKSREKFQKIIFDRFEHVQRSLFWFQPNVNSTNRMDFCADLPIGVGNILQENKNSKDEHLNQRSVASK